VLAKRLKKLRAESLHVLPGALTFHNQDGSRLSTLWWQNTWRAATAKVKITGRVPHELRHSAATVLKAAGITDDLIRRALGWSAAKVQENYTHLGPEHIASIGTVVDNLFAEKSEV
jgi:integrase